ITAELESYSRKTNEDRIKLKNALDQISSLMQNVTRQTDTSIRLSSDNLKKCHELKNCSKKDCECYGKEPMRCWQIAGTYCGGQVQGAFAQKYNNCSSCEVFKEATKDPIYEIGEHFNNMMHVLEVKSRELENAYSELKNTQAQILQREKMASIGQLAAGVAHEINNPTGFILSNLGTLGKYVDKLTEYIDAQSLALESLKADEVTAVLNDTRKKLKLDYVIEDVGQLINESIEGAERIKKIVQNLKTFSRVDQAEHKMADINECIESTLNIVWNELKYKTTVEKEYGPLPMTKCYPQQLNQIFMNLLVNAAQAIEKQGTIRIRTWNGDGSINVSISDTGSGIPEDKLGRIFDPFYTTKPVGQGTGLGLSIVYDIVKKHKGDIRVESKVGNGTVFTLKIPVEGEV
ncbi:MAG: ATP-binding protein, partial [Nitrospirota bacterium]